ncbi:LysE family translocator [Tepidimonas aquatica]|uniref:LysE family translocator n=1 Tax=Tepidimonas aquatica TaxID=247482 RepID=UPI00118531AA|nr:LysE family translocator [Tepidimonas aquatica]
MTWAECTALLTLATAASFTPGPNTTLSTALAAQGGLRRALPFVCAVPVGWALLLVLCAAGVGTLVLAVPWLRLGVLGGGVAYLLWLAWRLAGAGTPALGPQPPLRISFARGVALQFLNIKAWMLALSVVAGWIAGHPQAGQRLVWVLPVMVAYALASNLTYAMIGSALRGWLAGPLVQGRPSHRRLRTFNRLMAAALAVTALWMLASGLGGLR